MSKPQGSHSLKEALGLTKPTSPFFSPGSYMPRAQPKVGWEVKDVPLGSGPKSVYVDMVGQRAAVPSNGSIAGQVIRAHEASHLRYSPAGGPAELSRHLQAELGIGQLTNEELAAIEEVTVNTRLLMDCQAYGITTRELRRTQQETADPQDFIDKLGSLVAACEAMPQLKFSVGSALVNLTAWGFGEKVRRELDLPADLLKVLDEARCLLELVHGTGAGSAEDRIVPYRNDLAKALWELRPPPPPPPPQPNKRNGAYQHTPISKGDSDEMWAPLQVMEPDRTELVMRRRMKRTTDFGGRLTDPVKLTRFQDRLAFKRRVRLPTTDAPSLLVDVSGSMHMTEERLDKVLATMPASTVAFYSGTNSQGYLLVVAKGGRRIPRNVLLSRWADMPGGNACDGLALRWLAKQPGPRIWLSDGGITGRGREDKLQADVNMVNAAANIRRIDPWDVFGDAE